MVQWVTVTVTVPESAVHELQVKAAELTEREMQIQFDRFSPETVREAYFGGASDGWRMLLKVMAHESKTTGVGVVPWEKLVDTMNMSARQLAGVLSGGERRLKGKLPYNKEQRGDLIIFHMRPEVADQIIELAQSGD